jgi:NitT/TauT family transport system substrate-binding protein
VNRVIDTRSNGDRIEREINVNRIVRFAIVVSLLAFALVGAAIGGTTPAVQASPRAVPSGLRLGYLVNLTHADAMVGVQEGFFQKHLGSRTHLQTSTFNAGPAEVDALDEGALDAAYMGPSSAITPFEQSHGQALEVVSGATSGGASLVVRSAITTPAQLKGTILSSPQLGNTQDVALRYWLKRKGLTTELNGGGDVAILPQSNSAIVTAFASGQITGAWVPEPYAAEMVAEGGHVLVDEATLWPKGQFATTALVVRKQFAERYPTAVKELLQGQVEANGFINAHPAKAQQAVNAQFTALAGKALKQSVLAAAWKKITFTDNPIVSSWTVDARHAASVGLSVGSLPVARIFDLGPLNQVLRADHEAPVPTGASS